MNAANRPIRFLMLLAAAAMLGLLPACNKSNEYQAPAAPTSTEVESDQPEPLPDDQPAPEDDVEVIKQGGGELVDPIIDDGGPSATGEDDPVDLSIDPALIDPEPAESEDETEMNNEGEDETTEDSPLSALPGFVPVKPKPTPDPGAQGMDNHTRAAGPIAPDAPVMLHVTVFEVLIDDRRTLAPLVEFFAQDQADTLDDDEVRALFEMLTSLGGQGMINPSVIKRVATPRLLVNAGQSGGVDIMRLMRVAAGQMDVALPPDQLTLTLAPKIVHDDSPEPALVKVDYDLGVGRKHAPFTVHAEGLALDIGPRARVAGTGVVPDGHSFYFVRRVVGPVAEHELLLLIRPQVMDAEFNK